MSREQKEAGMQGGKHGMRRGEMERKREDGREAESSRTKQLSLLQKLAKGLLMAPKPPRVDACYPAATASLDEAENTTAITEQDIEYLEEVKRQYGEVLGQSRRAGTAGEMMTLERPSSWPEVSVPRQDQQSVMSLPQPASTSEEESPSGGMYFPLLSLTRGGTDAQNAAFEELLDQFCKVNGMKGRYDLVRTVLHETRKDPDIAQKLSRLGIRRRREHRRRFNAAQAQGLTMAEWILEERARLKQEVRVEDIEYEAEGKVTEGQLLVEACKYLGLRDPRDSPSPGTSSSSSSMSPGRLVSCELQDSRPDSATSGRTGSHAVTSTETRTRCVTFSDGHVAMTSDVNTDVLSVELHAEHGTNTEPGGGTASALDQPSTTSINHNELHTENTNGGKSQNADMEAGRCQDGGRRTNADTKSALNAQIND